MIFINFVKLNVSKSKLLGVMSKLETWIPSCDTAESSFLSGPLTHFFAWSIQFNFQLIFTCFQLIFNGFDVFVDWKVREIGKIHGKAAQKQGFHVVWVQRGQLKHSGKEGKRALAQCFWCLQGPRGTSIQHQVDTKLGNFLALGCPKYHRYYDTKKLSTKY